MVEESTDTALSTKRLKETVAYAPYEGTKADAAVRRTLDASETTESAEMTAIKIS